MCVCVYLYMCEYEYICIYVYIYIYLYIYMYVCTYIHMHISIYTFKWVCMLASVCVIACVFVCVCVCACVYLRLCICVYLCMCEWYFCNTSHSKTKSILQLIWCHFFWLPCLLWLWRAARSAGWGQIWITPDMSKETYLIRTWLPKEALFTWYKTYFGCLLWLLSPWRIWE